MARWLFTIIKEQVEFLVTTSGTLPKIISWNNLVLAEAIKIQPWFWLSCTIW